MKNLCTFPLYAILSMLKTREVFIQVFFIHWEYIIPLYVYVLYSSSRRVGVQVVCKNIFPRRCRRACLWRLSISEPRALDAEELGRSKWGFMYRARWLCKRHRNIDLNKLIFSHHQGDDSGVTQLSGLLTMTLTAVVAFNITMQFSRVRWLFLSPDFAGTLATAQQPNPFLCVSASVCPNNEWVRERWGWRLVSPSRRC